MTKLTQADSAFGSLPGLETLGFAALILSYLGEPARLARSSVLVGARESICVRS